MKMTVERLIFLVVVLILLPVQSLRPALLESDISTPIVLVARENLLLDGDPIGNPVTFFIEDNNPLINAILSPGETTSFQDVKMWQIQIFNSDDEKVSFVQGRKGLPSRMIPWSGFSTAGEPLPDGFYKARFVWIDAQEKFHETPKTLVNLSTPLEIRNLLGFDLRFEYTDEGLVIRIPEILIFGVGKYKIRENILPALKEVVAFLKSHPRNKVVVRGHTDSTGQLGLNMTLSRRRAYSVYRYFIDNGIKPNRLTYQGLGPNQPIASNLTKAGRAKNRRVEVVVLRTTIG